MFKGGNDSNEEALSYSKVFPCFPFQVYIWYDCLDVHYEHTVWKSTRSKTLMYKKEKLFIPRAMWFLHSYFPHGDILMGPRHQLLIINISHLPLSAQQTLLDPVVSSMCWADGK